MFFIYTILVHILFILFLPVLILHPKLKGGFLSRLGFYPIGWPGKKHAPVIWFHGASAGDLLALQPVISLLKSREPSIFSVVTTQTNSGYTVAKHMQHVDAVAYAPVDLPWSAKRAVERIRPALLVLECAEIWPAWLRAVKRNKARIAIVNGRFDRRLLWRYRWLYRLIGNPLKHVDLFCMLDEEHAKRAISLGAEEQRVCVYGNTKLDACKLDEEIKPTELTELARGLGLPDPDGSGGFERTNTSLVWVAGSTHDREEQMLLAVYARLRRKFTDLRLVLAPRYIERARRVEDMVREHGFSCGFRTKVAQRDHPVVILDTVGELRHAYHLADVVVVGGSFVRRGGHNIIEPAACGKPVIFGPHMENARAAVQTLLGRGGFQVENEEQLEELLTDLFLDRHKIERWGTAAKSALESMQGASEACCQAILELMDYKGD